MVVPEVVVVDLVGGNDAIDAAGTAQLHHLGDDDVGGSVRRIEQAVQRRIEQIVADHDEARMTDGVGPVIGHHITHGHAARDRIDRRQPAMDLALAQMGARIAERCRQRLDRRVNQFLVGQIGEGQRIGARDQPIQHAMLADIVAGAFVIDAAAAEGF